MAKLRDEKNRCERHKVLTQQLAASHLEAIDAVERYALRFGPATGEALVTMIEDLATVFEQGTTGGAAIREIVGDDPVRFTEDFLRNYPTNPWVDQEQQRLARAVHHAGRAGG